MEPTNRSSSTMATRPILGRMAVFPSTFTVQGPLSARKPCSCLRRLNLGKPTRQPGRCPDFFFRRYSPQLSTAWPKSTMAYLAAFWDNSVPHFAIIPLTLFHRGRKVRSLNHSPTSRPALNSPSAQL